MIGRSCVAGRSEPMTSLRAKTLAALKRSPDTSSSTRPKLFALSALMALPVEISVNASFIATSLGNRAVPPAPGINPRFTSGKPSEVLSSAILKRQPSVISSPPPNAVPCTAATQGTRACSIALISSGRVGDCGGLPNSVMSAPATNVVPAHLRMTAFTDGFSLV